MSTPTVKSDDRLRSQWGRRQATAFERDYGSVERRDVWRFPELCEPGQKPGGTAPKLWISPIVVLAVAVLIILVSKGSL